MRFTLSCRHVFAKHVGQFSEEGTMLSAVGRRGHAPWICGVPTLLAASRTTLRLGMQKIRLSGMKIRFGTKMIGLGTKMTAGLGTKKTGLGTMKTNNLFTEWRPKLEN